MGPGQHGQYHWRVLERADGELIISYHGETVDLQESPQPLSSLWGATNPCTLGLELQPIADDSANGHLELGAAELLDSLEASHEEEVNAKRVVTKVGRGAGLGTRCTGRLFAPSRLAGRPCRRPRGKDSPCGLLPEAGHVPGGRR